MSKKSAREAYNLTLLTLPSIFVTKDALPTTQGFSEEEMQDFGLSRDELKLLERQGLAVRGRFRTKEGDRLRWALIKNDA